MHAQTTLAVAEIYRGHRYSPGWADLEERLDVRRLPGSSEDVVRILINFVETALDLKRYDMRIAMSRKRSRSCDEREFELYRNLLNCGSRRWRSTGDVGMIAEQQALTLLGRVASIESSPCSGARRARPASGAPRRSGRMGGARRGDRRSSAAGSSRTSARCTPLAPRWPGWAATRRGRVTRPMPRTGARTAQLRLHRSYGDLSFWAWRAGRIQELPDGTDGCLWPACLRAASGGRDEPGTRSAVRTRRRKPSRTATTKPICEPRSDSFRCWTPESSSRRFASDSTTSAHGGSPAVRVRALDRIPAGLSAREMDVLALIRAGARNAEIAETLVLSLKTVDHHVSAVLRKLGVTDREAARREAERRGIELGGSTGPT